MFVGCLVLVVGVWCGSMLLVFALVFHLLLGLNGLTYD